MSDKNNNLNEEEFEDAFDQVTLTLEDGSEMTCDVIAIFPCQDRDYIALLPENDPDSMCEILFSSGTSGYPKMAAHCHRYALFLNSKMYIRNIVLKIQKKLSVSLRS